MKAPSSEREVRRPAAVLVHGEAHAHRVGEVGEPRAGLEVQHEWLLAQHVATRPKDLLDDVDALRGM